jgi:hypothetical protein
LGVSTFAKLVKKRPYAIQKRCFPFQNAPQKSQENVILGVVVLVEILRNAEISRNVHVYGCFFCFGFLRIKTHKERDRKNVEKWRFTSK